MEVQNQTEDETLVVSSGLPSIEDHQRWLAAAVARIAAKDAEIEKLKAQVGLPVRRHLPNTRRAVTHKFSVGGHEGYMTVGMFDDGTPGELFLAMAKEGSTIGGLMDTIGTLTSMALQYGVDMEVLSTKFSYQRFEPSGWTANADIKMATSIIDYVFRWMQNYFVKDRNIVPVEPVKVPAVETVGSAAMPPLSSLPSPVQSDAPACPKCGRITVRAGKCHVCPNCGETTGCS